MSLLFGDNRTHSATQRESVRGGATEYPKHSDINATLLAAWRKLHARLRLAVTQSAEYARPNMVWVALVAVIGFPLYYVVWAFIFPQPYENLPLRLLGSALAAPMLLAGFVPSSWQRYFDIYWFFALCYALPFFFTFMLLKNDVSVTWSMSTMAAVVLLVLLIYDWILLTLMAFAGCGLAWILFYLSGDHLAQGVTSYLVQTPIYLFVLVAGSIFNYKTALVKQERLQAMSATSSTIAHELRTPLLGIRSGIGGLQRYLPQLLHGYELAQAHGLPVEHIRRAHYRELYSVLQRIEAETQYSNIVIDILLFNACENQINTSEFTRVSMSKCIMTALNRYPFKSNQERARVHWQTGPDFDFNGSTVLMEHVLFNLIKNSLQSTNSVDKGDITIRVAAAMHGYNLLFRDTGQGIAPDDLAHVFDRFYSTMAAGHGTGIGLAFCRMVMTSFGGTIECSSRLGEYTEFVLHFPNFLWRGGHGNT